MDNIVDAQVDRVGGDNLQNSNGDDGSGDANNDLFLTDDHVLDVGGC